MNILQHALSPEEHTMHGSHLALFLWVMDFFSILRMIRVYPILIRLTHTYLHLRVRYACILL
jgi:hypothetical protein